MDWQGRVAAAYHKVSAVMRLSDCGSSAMLQTRAPVYDKYLGDQMVTGIFRGERAAREHKKLLECALSRDAATARDVLAIHIQACVGFTIARGKLAHYRMNILES